MSKEVVLGGLDVPVPRIQHLPRGQRLEEGLTQVDILPQAGTGVEKVHAVDGHDAFVDIRAAAVVSDIIGANHQRGDPENLGPGELCFGHPHTGLGSGHDQRAGVGEPQGGGKIDRKAHVVGLERRRFELCGHLVQRRRRRDRWPRRSRQGLRHVLGGTAHGGIDGCWPRGPGQRRTLIRAHRRPGSGPRPRRRHRRGRGWLAQGRGGAVFAVARATGACSGPAADVVGEVVGCTEAEVDGTAADDWARHANGSSH